MPAPHWRASHEPRHDRNGRVPRMVRSGLYLRNGGLMSPVVFRERLNQALANRPKWKVLSHKAGYEPSYIRALASGKRCNPTIACVAALSEALNVSPAWLLGIEPQAPVQSTVAPTR